MDADSALPFFLPLEGVLIGDDSARSRLRKVRGGMSVSTTLGLRGVVMAVCRGDC